MVVPSVTHLIHRVCRRNCNNDIFGLVLPNNTPEHVKATSRWK